mmetsp:Transcript_149365/g.461079  ORF Transcript_149365/g.461079 Transcript_149365/m.461079 type:complete len:207 (-) Transcript_149365:512-1132(-)
MAPSSSSHCCRQASSVRRHRICRSSMPKCRGKTCTCQSQSSCACLSAALGSSGSSWLASAFAVKQQSHLKKLKSSLNADLLPLETSGAATLPREATLAFLEALRTNVRSFSRRRRKIQRCSCQCSVKWWCHRSVPRLFHSTRLASDRTRNLSSQLILSSSLAASFGSLRSHSPRLALLPSVPSGPFRREPLSLGPPSGASSPCTST